MLPRRVTEAFQRAMHRRPGEPSERAAIWRGETAKPARGDLR
jgi:hypothetical protein